jgi:hypothetical protein
MDNNNGDLDHIFKRSRSLELSIISNASNIFNIYCCKIKESVRLL